MAESKAKAEARLSIFGSDEDGRVVLVGTSDGLRHLRRLLADAVLRGESSTEFAMVEEPERLFRVDVHVVTGKDFEGVDRMLEELELRMQGVDILDLSARLRRRRKPKGPR